VIFEYILDFKDVSGLALAVKIFLKYQATTKSSQGIPRASDNFGGGGFLHQMDLLPLKISDFK
jgi:hypothetical protein